MILLVARGEQKDQITFLLILKNTNPQWIFCLHFTHLCLSIHVCTYKETFVGEATNWQWTHFFLPAIKDFTAQQYALIEVIQRILWGIRPHIQWRSFACIIKLKALLKRLNTKLVHIQCGIKQLLAGSCYSAIILLGMYVPWPQSHSPILL